jgi:hypothetical protein
MESNGIWAKGCLHIHTSNSDGDTSPVEVAKWYNDHGYQFISITDHGGMTDPTGLDSGLVYIPGEEIGLKTLPIHACALGIPATIDNFDGTIPAMVEHIRKAGGIPQVNHPNWNWAFGHREMLGIEGPYLLEVFNGHPAVNNAGNCAYLPVEQTWDILLSNGKTVYATATDDAHHFQTIEDSAANPGRGWVCAHVPELTPEAILDSLAKGDFYASTGVELDEIAFDGKEFRVEAKLGRRYLIRFIGAWGRILQETEGTSATYRIKGDESYVRCKVISSDGKVAWTQAYRIKG